jgi:PEP-CTERM motif
LAAQFLLSYISVKMFGRNSMKRSGLKQLLLTVGLACVAGVPASASLTYTCDPNINATVAGTCGMLNGTISGLYNSYFNDVNAKVYIQYGSTGLGGSFTALDGFTYGQFQTALNADKTSADDLTANGVGGSVPAANPFPTQNVVLTHANARALGLTAGTNGVCQAGVNGCAASGNCTISVANYGTSCFDSVITISNTASLWYRSLSSGSQTGSQYDFFSVVEHESDEVLGTISSCCGEIGGGAFFAPVDLFRYSSNGARNHAFGSNTACTVAGTTDNACFSINNGTSLLAGIQYNNLNNGADVGDFSTNCKFVQDAFGCPGGVGASHDISPSAEVRILDLVGFTSTNPVPEPGTVAMLGAGLVGLGWLRRKRV